MRGMMALRGIRLWWVAEEEYGRSKKDEAAGRGSAARRSILEASGRHLGGIHLRFSPLV